MTKSRDLANAATALNAVTATELGFVDGVTSAIQTQIDTKLATATAATTYQAINANVSTTELGYLDGVTSAIQTQLNQKPEFVAGKNKIINGDFNINQRAFSSTTSSGAYGLDRWQYVYSGGTVTYSAQAFTLGAAPVAGYEATNFARVLTASQSTSAQFAIFRQQIESARTFAGQTVTVSFWAKAASGTPKVGIELVQNFGSGGSPSADVLVFAGQATLSTSWARYSVTATVPSISGKTLGTNNNDVFIVHLFTSAGSNFDARTGSIGIQNNTIDFWGVQVEAGSVATAFQTATGTLQGELAACQRYFWQVALGSALMLGISFYFTSTQAEAFIQYPVTMRTTPVLIATSGANYYRTTYNGGLDNFDSLTINAANNQNTRVYNNTEMSGAAGSAGVFFTNNASSSVAFSAEL
jgi:hypothetical protein